MATAAGRNTARRSPASTATHKSPAFYSRRAAIAHCLAGYSASGSVASARNLIPSPRKQSSWSITTQATERGTIRAIPIRIAVKTEFRCASEAPGARRLAASARGTDTFRSAMTEERLLHRRSCAALTTGVEPRTTKQTTARNFITVQSLSRRCPDQPAFETQAFVRLGRASAAAPSESPRRPQLQQLHRMAVLRPQLPFAYVDPTHQRSEQRGQTLR